MTVKIKDMVEITPQTIVSELLNNYPQLEDKLIEIAPVFSKLKNPVLRRTIAKITTLRQAAIIGNVELGELINKLRIDAGQDPLYTGVSNKSSQEAIPEEILRSIPVSVYDAREDLEKGVHPLAKVMKDVTMLKEAQVYKLITSFIPAPLIAKVKEKGFEAWTNVSDEKIETYITRH